MINQIKVWDPLVRIFHWSLVIAFTVAYLSGDEENAIHINAGYIILGLIIFRLIWGFIGSKYARFKDFTYSPRSIINYLKSLFTRQPKHYIGHNPAGGAMILALLIGLTVTTYSGLKIYAIEEGAGPLAQSTELSLIKTAYADDDNHDGYDEDNDEEFWEEIHEASANIVLLLVVLHIVGVIVAGKLHNEKLIKAMITGKKTSE